MNTEVKEKNELEEYKDKIIEENKRRWYKYDTINIFLISILLIISVIAKCVSPVRTASQESKIRKSSDSQRN